MLNYSILFCKFSLEPFVSTLYLPVCSFCRPNFYKPNTLLCHEQIIYLPLYRHSEYIFFYCSGNETLSRAFVDGRCYERGSFHFKHIGTFPSNGLYSPPPPNLYFYVNLLTWQTKDEMVGICASSGVQSTRLGPETRFPGAFFFALGKTLQQYRTIHDLYVISIFHIHLIIYSTCSS
jgi:hypothetical protein